MCRREAPDVEQFARAHADEVTVIGLGNLVYVVDWNDFSRGLRTGAYDARPIAAAALSAAAGASRPALLGNHVAACQRAGL